MVIKKLLTAATTFVVITMAASNSARATEPFPSRPVRIIVPYNAGGAGDVMARALGRALERKLGQPVVVMNRPGASGMIGAAYVAQAKGDPYTLLLGSSAEIAIDPLLYKSMAYSPKTDLIPVALVGKLPLVLVANPAVSAKNLGDLIAIARREPGSVTYASAGVGQLAHLGMVDISKAAGVRMTHIPFKGGSEAVLGVMQNQAQVFLSGLPPAIPQMKSGKLRVLAVTTAQRVPQLPNVPTVAESGSPNFDIFNWFAVFAPAGVSTAIVNKLNVVINEAVREPEVTTIFSSQGILVDQMSPSQLNAFVSQESIKYSELVKNAGLKPE